MTPMRVCAITAGRNAPPARFRIRQHLQALHGMGIEVTEYVPRVPQAMPMPGMLRHVRRRWLGPVAAAWAVAHAASRLPAILDSQKFDAVWLERSFAPGLDRLARAIRRPLVLDIDDAVWLEGLAGRGLPGLAQQAAGAIAGNRYLADWLAPHCANVHIVPTAVDCRRFTPAVPDTPTRPPGFVIGWTGTAGNFRYLESIAPALARVLREVPGASLLVIAERQPSLTALAGLPVTFVPWSPATEVTALAAADVGIMPLEDSEWTRGKCSFKMLQYMALGLPTVVSPVGMNRDVLAHGESGIAAESQDDWVDALRRLAGDLDLRHRLGATGRQVALAHYDVPVVAARIATALRSVT